MVNLITGWWWNTLFLTDYGGFKGFYCFDHNFIELVFTELVFD